MEMDLFSFFENYFLAILLGALMGLERERKKVHLAGLRTFILVTLFGCICGQISSLGQNRWVIWAGIIAVTVQSVSVRYLRARSETSVGLTTATALLVAFGIGVLVAFDQAEISVALSLLTTIILHFKPQMHAFSRSLSEKDISAIFQFGLIAFIVLPILPDQGYGPYNALNPYNIWLMVVMISGINLVGYVALKILGERWGGAVVGILGGLISSTATTLTFSRHVKNRPGLSMVGVLVVSLASTVVLLRVTFLVGVIHPELLDRLALPMIGMFLCGLVSAFIVWKKSREEESPPLEARNPMELKQALLIGLLYAFILVSISAGKDFLGDKGVYIVSLVSGLTDVDAITLSNARLVGTGALEPSQAAVSILLAFVSNLGFKLTLVGAIGSRQMLLWTFFCFACLAVPALLILV